MRTCLLLIFIKALCLIGQLLALVRGVSQGKTPAELLAWCLASITPAIDCDSAAAQTFAQADTAGDGIISPHEWLELVTANPSIIDYMTLPVLKEVCLSHVCTTMMSIRGCPARAGLIKELPTASELTGGQ